ncbi:MAG TPA: serine/threonine-protein kinase [Candidatus Angelobacter sp.]|nr:serine/threonine-protein kinase [Candidatus Angelobacter sp.]
MNVLSQREEEIFDTAQKLDSAARRAYLMEACAADAAMRARIEELLAVKTEAEKFFAEGKAALASANIGTEDQSAVTSVEEPPGTRIGRYKLLQKIGEGGCGMVYMAQQEVPVRRRVALKIIKLGMDTKSVIARFEAERQALAMMDHPNIARVLDAGATETGRPYFVMELVRGVKITDYADEEQLDTRQRLDLFIQICHAIQHAHQKGIIHRDIKPSNILVTLHDGVPVPKVIDFGIAKATETSLTDKTLFTAFGQFIGTPAYMSPEQAEMKNGLDVDTRSDIYSLGVLLYELLTGKTPFDPKKLMQSGLDEMRRTLRECEPQRPSTMLTTLQGGELTATARRRQAEPPKLISLVRGDLDWIVLKAMEKDRGRRYETANGLSMDVQRYLQNEPVLARPPSRVYRFQKLFRRNRAVFIGGLAVAIALIIGFGTSTFLFIQEKRAHQRAVAAEQLQFQLRREAERARSNEAELRRKAEIGEAISQATIYISQERFPEADELIGHTELNQPTIEGAAVLRALGEWLALQGKWKPAAQRFEGLWQANQFDDWDFASLDCLRWGVVLAELGDRDAFEHFRRLMIARYEKTTNPVAAERAIKICALLPPPDADLKELAPLEQLTAKTFSTVDENNPEAVFQAAWGCVSLALMEYRQGNYLESEKWSRRCLSFKEDVQPRTATAHVLLAMACRQAGQTQEAASELAKGRESIEKTFGDSLDRGDGPRGFWFDWIFARVLLQEGAALIQPNP